MYDKFITYCNNKNIYKQGDKILLAVSGGIDSMVMAELFIKAKANIAVAHCNFSLRDKESDGDEQFVREFSAENDIPLFIKKFDTASFADREGISIQMAARNLRHKWFEEIRQSLSFDLIALGHNSDDNIETFL
ncbi:MAG: tRNA lysidine(34) synthetase TilS, partial [Bacteroidales bacterium]|nr:tRNA lysidine(34) synthetase TilS [Bacteroidales bacterium]